MKIGLDLGTSEFRSVFPEGGRLFVRRVPSEYAAIDNTTENRSLLNQIRCGFLTCGSHLLVIGRSARQVSEITRAPVIPVLPEGVLPQLDPVSRQLCDVLMQCILPAGLDPNAELTCTFPLADARRGFETREFLKRLLRLKSMTVREIHPATALLLAQGESLGFTAICLVFGANSTSWSINQHGVDVGRGTVPQGLRQIISRLSQDRHHYVWDVRGNRLVDYSWGESFLRDESLDLSHPRTGEEQILAQHVQQTLTSVFSEITQTLNRLPPIAHRGQKIPILTGGGASQIKGISTLVRRSIGESDCPCRVGEIQISSPEPFLIARGALISAELDSLPKAA